MNQKLLKKYAELTVKVGANVQPNQKVLVRAAIDQGAFVKEIVAEAYKAGARKVEIQWEFQEAEKLDQQHQTLETLSTMEPWQILREKEQVNELPAMIYILSDDPDGLSGVDQALTHRQAAVDTSRRR